MMDENNKSILSDEEMDQVAGGYIGYIPLSLKFSPSGKKIGTGNFVWEYCNNAYTPECGPDKCRAHGSADCIDGNFRRR